MILLIFLDSHLIPRFSFPRTDCVPATLECVAVPSDSQVSQHRVGNAVPIVQPLGTKPTPRQPWLLSCTRPRLSLSSTAAPNSLPTHYSITKSKEIGSHNQEPPPKPCWAQHRPYLSSEGEATTLLTG